MNQRIEQQKVALVVEGDTDVRGLATALLEETGFHVFDVSSSEEALHYLHHHAAEVAFLFSEVTLSCLMTGVDLARTVRLKWPWIRTVLTSDAPVGDQLDKALTQVRFMPKPWLALQVLIEAEKAAEANRFEQAMFRSHRGVLAKAAI
jgi:CheY-like chemotaxis protein